MAFIVGDNNEMINMCLNCPLPKCVNCLDVRSKHGTPSGKRTMRRSHGGRPKKGISPVEQLVLQYYATSVDDKDIASHSKFRVGSVTQARLNLGLPPLRRNPPDIRKQMAAEVKARMDKLYGS